MQFNVTLSIYLRDQKMKTNKKDVMYGRIQKHGEALISFFGTQNGGDVATLTPIQLCRKLRRLEVKANRIACDYCNGDIDSEQWENESNEIWNKLVKIVGSFGAKYCFINGDPRGYTLKIKDEFMTHKNGIDRDWGGYGILAPDLS